MITYDFSDKVAFVTGGSSGIGLATALAFARAGAKLAIASRGEESGRQACAAIKKRVVLPYFSYGPTCATKPR
jgi:NAD(P)-dependent dehydrogenase (short-subunit alcohol dehydrogenase family)